VGGGGGGRVSEFAKEFAMFFLCVASVGHALLFVCVYVQV